eukprot:1265083-Rhodomonas_salina.1
MAVSQYPGSNGSWKSLFFRARGSFVLRGSSLKLPHPSCVSERSPLGNPRRYPGYPRTRVHWSKQGCIGFVRQYFKYGKFPHSTAEQCESRTGLTGSSLPRTTYR